MTRSAELCECGPFSNEFEQRVRTVDGRLLCRPSTESVTETGVQLARKLGSTTTIAIVPDASTGSSRKPRPSDDLPIERNEIEQSSFCLDSTTECKPIRKRLRCGTTKQNSGSTYDARVDSADDSHGRDGRPEMHSRH